MKKIKEPGLEYCMDLRITPARSYRDFVNQLARVGGRENANAIVNYMSDRSAKENKGETPDYCRFYELKNVTPEFSLTLSGALEGVYIRNMCNWLAKHREFFEGTVLDVGCGCGILSCFIAKTFPEVKVTGVDLCEKSVVSARALAERLGLTNTEFICGEAENTEGTFDTVLSSQVAHETFGYFSLGVDVPLEEYAEVCKNQTLRYAKSLSNLVSENGRVISVERFGNNPLLLGWIRAISEAGLRIDTENFMTFDSPELGNPVQFVLTVSSKGEPYPKEVLDRFYAVALVGDPAWNQNPVSGWLASLKLHLMKGELIDGYNGYNIYGKKVIKVALWTNKLDKKSILCEALVANEDRYDVSDIMAESKDKCLETMQKDRENFRAQNFTIRDFRILDGKEVEDRTI